MQYFQFYGYLSQQQNMLQDFIRTHTYQRAILGNIDDFKVCYVTCFLILLIKRKDCAMFLPEHWKELQVFF